MLKKTVIAYLALMAALFALTSTSRAQPIYTNTFNSPGEATNWAVLFDYTMTDPLAHIVSNNLVVIGWDYTTVGIPIAPHSAEFGSATIHKGLKLSSCYTNAATKNPGAAVVGLSTCPTNFSISQNFVMHADMWINVNCTAYGGPTNDYTLATGTFADNNHDSTASTVLYGCGYGTAGTQATTPGQSDAIWCGTLTDNGTTAQIRMYSSSQTGSYQDATYQTSGTLTPSFPGDPYVYNSINGLPHDTSGNGPGGRNIISTTANPPYTPTQMGTNATTGVAWRTIFPPQLVPVAEANLYPQQANNYCLPGYLDFKWHDVSVEKVGNVIIYKVDGNILATGNYASAGTPPGNFLTFVASRTGSTVAAATSSGAPTYTNLNFAVFANIVVSNYDNIVNVTAPNSSCQEGQAGSQGLFDINRPSSGVPLTITYTLTGTATNGVQYQTLPTTTNFDSTATDIYIPVTPIDDGIANPTTTVVLTLQSGTGYVGAGSAVVNILDGDTPTIDISSPDGAQAYGRYTNSPGPGMNADFIPFTLTRRGLLTTGSPLSVTFNYSGDAVSGTDFAPATANFPDGMSTATASIVPVYNPAIATNRTVIVTVASGTGYAVGTGTASGTIVSANYPITSPVVLFDALTNSMDATNWSVVYGCGDPLDDATDFIADFGIDLTSTPGGLDIPQPPGTNAYALYLTCNKNGSPSSAGAVNAYYTNLFLSGNYAVRFNMNIIEGDSKASSTEGPIFGINHTGSCSNWWWGGGFITNQTWSADGIWYFVDAQGGGSARGDYQEYAGIGNTVNGVVTNTGEVNLANLFQSSFTQVFKDSQNAGPFTTFDINGNQTPGIPANESPNVGYDISTWSDVEIKQLNGIVTMSINHTPIFVLTNTTSWQSGYLMLGYADPYGATVASSDAGVYYSNLQVVQLPLLSVITINNIAISGNNVVIKFTTSNPADATTSFTLQSSGTVNGTYGAVSPAANITSLGSNQFQATVPYVGGIEFYQVMHN